jgi:hypothetical protein
LRRPLMLLGMKRSITMYSACLALGGGLSVFDRYGSPCGAHSEASLQRQIERLAQEFVLQCLSRSTAAASCAAVVGGHRRGGGAGFPRTAMISKSDGPGRERYRYT